MRGTGQRRPLAVFDCDGTVIKGDIGEAMFFRQIEQFHFRLNPAALWPDHPRRKELGKAYEKLALLPPEERTRDPAFEPFARMLSRLVCESDRGAERWPRPARISSGSSPVSHGQKYGRLPNPHFYEELSTPF